MMNTLPGTAIEFDVKFSDNAFAQIEPILSATGGITLSQLSKLTGLEGSTVQNWVKRGWVSSAVGKKYGEKQVARILLINVLRGTMKLEDIARLMTYINGDVDDQSDDILHDKQLYNLMCSLLYKISRKRLNNAEEISREIENGISEVYRGESRKRLKKVLLIMVYGCMAACYRLEAEQEFSQIEE